MDLETVTAEITQVLITKEQIETRIAELAKELDAYYQGKDLLLVGVLKGAVMAT